MKIRTKFSLIFLTLSLIPIIITGSIVYFYGKKTIEKSIGQSFRKIAQEIADKLDRDIYGIYLDAHTWSQLGLMQGILSGDVDSRISSFLIGLNREYKYFSGINVMNDQGKVAASSNPEMKDTDFSARPFFKTAIGGNVYMDDVHFDEEVMNWVLTFSFPIKSEPDKKKVIGVLSANIKASEIGTITQTDREGEYYGDTIILRKDGVLIAGPEREKNNLYKINMIIAGLGSARLAAEKQEGYAVEGFRGANYLIGFEHSKGYNIFPGFGWAVLVAQDAGKVFTPVERLKDIILGVGLFMSLLVVFVSFFIARKISKPIIDMSYVADRVARSDFAGMVTHRSRDEIGHLVRVFNKMIHDLKEQRSKLVDKEELERHYNIQHVVNALLKASFEDVSLDEFLTRALGLVFSVKWFSYIPKGSIFLSEEKPDSMTMKAQIGLSEPLKKTCKEIFVGRCLCGRAAKTGVVQFAEKVNDAHEISYEGMIPHGHYCVPIISSRKVIGVLSIYLKEGHVYDKRDEEFLVAVSNALASSIERKCAEEDLKKTYLELRKAQDQLIQSEKLAALGRFSAGLAHEVKNPLAIITGGIEAVEMNLAKGVLTDMNEDIYRIKLAIARADTVIKELLLFAKPSQLKMEKINPKILVNDAVSLVKYKMPLSNILIGTEFLEEEFFVSVDRNQMEQVIVNILLNSIDAMPKGGDVSIRTYLTEFEDKKACAIDITDTGEGIRKEDLGRLFEPFFTTKRDRRGTGLGLSISKTIVNNHKGDMSIESEYGKGTTVKIVLPVI